ncbi:cGMP phosphodiesterase a4 [Cryptosporidium ubiquitum]|uniref:cGMP phosphodiesterase a4 n=1 Tax=Cryptosporidium ubiquitum TaxID=857276 RepID=A0A1J4MJK5_9CRYT|nr:cGMP phosphodiesterase a4 [Cryptosporidium ubiquitum]OII74199.1 cGMP phosphodiesterase a4 [Cryptosporidium ubiquitum]
MSGLVGSPSIGRTVPFEKNDDWGLNLDLGELETYENRDLKTRLKELISPFKKTFSSASTLEYLHPFTLKFRSEILEKKFKKKFRKRTEIGIFWIGLLTLFLIMLDILLEIYNQKMNEASNSSVNTYFIICGVVAICSLFLIISFFINFLNKHLEIIFTSTTIITTILNITAGNLLLDASLSPNNDYDPAVQNSRSLIVITICSILHFMLPISFISILIYSIASISFYIILVPSMLRPIPNETQYVSTIIYLLVFCLVCILAKRVNVSSSRRDFFNINLVKAEMQILENSMNQAPKSTMIEGTLANINKVQLFLRYLNTSCTKGINRKLLHDAMVDLTSAQVTLCRSDDIYAVDPVAIFLPQSLQTNVSQTPSRQSKIKVIGSGDATPKENFSPIISPKIKQEIGITDDIRIPISPNSPKLTGQFLSPKSHENKSSYISIDSVSARRNTESRATVTTIPGPSRRRLSMMIANAGENSSTFIDPSVEKVREYITAEFTKSSASRREVLYASKVFDGSNSNPSNTNEKIKVVSQNSDANQTVENMISRQGPLNEPVVSGDIEDNYKHLLKNKRKVAHFATHSVSKLLSIKNPFGTISSLSQSFFNETNPHNFTLPELPKGVNAELYSDLDKALQLMDNQYSSNWDLDMWRLNELTKGNCLAVAGLYMLHLIASEEKTQELNFDSSSLPRGITTAYSSSITAPSKLIGNISKFNIFFRELNIRYLNNKYHNELHGTNVCHHAICLTRATGLWDHLDTVERLASVVASLGHDVGHIGRTSNFLVNSRHMLAINYNDRSVLEMFHASLTFRIIYYYGGGAADFLQNWDAELHKEFRRIVIELILETDMHRHFECVSRFRVRRQAVDWDPYGDVQDRLMLARTCLKAADIGHGALKWNQHYKWCRSVVEEFFLQGDEEKALSLPISPICDRESTDVPKSQVGFLNFVCLPLFQELCYVDVEGDVRRCIDRILENINNWEDIAEAGIQWDSEDALTFVTEEKVDS